MRHSSYYFQVLALVLTACAGGSDTPSTRGQLTDERKAADSSTSGSSQSLKELQARDATEAAELADLKEVNQKLCERLQRVRSECAATFRLIPSDADKVLACTLGNSTDSVLTGNFEMDFNGDGRKYRLLADNNWESNPFGNGVTKITWKARLESSTDSPRMIDMSTLEIRPEDGGTVGGFPSKVELRASGNMVINGGDLRQATESHGYWIVSLQRILDIKKSSQCTVTEEEITALIGK